MIVLMHPPPNFWHHNLQPGPSAACSYHCSSRHHPPSIAA